jgi:hypothetical protein
MNAERQWTDDDLVRDWMRRFSKNRRLIVSAAHADEERQRLGNWMRKPSGLSMCSMIWSRAIRTERGG